MNVRGNGNRRAGCVLRVAPWRMGSIPEPVANPHRFDGRNYKHSENSGALHLLSQVGSDLIADSDEVDDRDPEQTRFERDLRQQPKLVFGAVVVAAVRRGPGTALAACAT